LLFRANPYLVARKVSRTAGENTSDHEMTEEAPSLDPSVPMIGAKLRDAVAMLTTRKGMAFVL
jgi:hypothetical protein